jgi:hypothetical protein
MSKAKFTAPPKKGNDTAQTITAPRKDENKLLKIINKGGTPANTEPSSGEVVLKSINLKIPETDLSDFKKIIDKIPKEPGKKKAISIDRWILQAACEKRDLLLKSEV